MAKNVHHMTKPEQIFGQPHRYIHSLDITIHVHILVYVGFIGIHIIAYLHTNIQTAKVLCIPIHIQSQQRYYMYPPHMIRCIIHVPMKQHRQSKIYHQRKIHWYAFAFILAKYAITHTGESRANLLCSLYPHFRKHFHRCWRFFLIPMFSHSQRYKGYTDSYICTCMFIYYTLLLYTHLYSYMHVFTCTRLYTHTCPVYLGKLLEFPSVTRQHLKTNIKKIYISISR